MANILPMGRSKELSKVHAAHMDAALQTQVKTEPVNAISTAVTEKKKSRQKGATSSQAFHMSCGGMEMEQNFSLTSVFDDDDEGSVDFCNCRSLLPNPRVVVDEPLLAAQEGADMQSTEITQRPDPELPEPLPTDSRPSRRGLEQYNLRPCKTRSTR
ncbi:hypothetical protein NDU88_002186 [Pleurodeles waltl]|uniref:Uncharacterized protein n=1 Tax=Pleurodeles waltl TaxID=8319 RepID=A0AAV7TLV7_PLEWA|nr:hypothetical protein NDU88_002186 [Pleurodeles waltl]